jgi:hypothetical protein
MSILLYNTTCQRERKHLYLNERMFYLSSLVKYYCQLRYIEVDLKANSKVTVILLPTFIVRLAYLERTIMRKSAAEVLHAMETIHDIRSLTFIYQIGQDIQSCMILNSIYSSTPIQQPRHIAAHTPT